ncbi:MAG: hypothetical protein M3209_13280 [Acidobacteriota bacterium]|nr:hypothetical protein [Acidobacteriota bacterium]
MNKKCPECDLVNFSSDENCHRCSALLCSGTDNSGVQDDTSRKLDRAAIWFLKRFLSAVVIAAVILCGVYFSLLRSAEPLTSDQAVAVERAIQILEERGFERETFLLRRTAAYRASDNWLNDATGHNDAYAATNFPFQIVTLYESFFKSPKDDIERAMILLHEAQHLQGAGESEAYEFVWRNRKKLGWTDEAYNRTEVWRSVFDFTRQNAPNIFQCNFNEHSDCTL